MVSFDERAQRAVIDVRCSKGTYVRQIAADLGAATAAGGYCSELRRTEVGEFTVDRAASPERILEEGDGPWMIQPREALPHLPGAGAGRPRARGCAARADAAGGG